MLRFRRSAFPVYADRHGDLRLLLRIAAATLNLVLPGTGLCLIGRYRMAMAVQALLFGTVAILCWSRLVFQANAIAASLAILALVHLTSSGLCLTMPIRGYPPRWRYSAAILFASVSLVLAALVFVHKADWLGVQIYFVPSMSMYPALKPGQFILIDTWRYRSHAPTEGDVVVFRQTKEGFDMVKRIADWPDGSRTVGGKWYVLGDDRAHSLDSRVFGGIERSQLIGQARLVLAGIDAQGQGLQTEFLAPVR